MPVLGQHAEEAVHAAAVRVVRRGRRVRYRSRFVRPHHPPERVDGAGRRPEGPVQRGEAGRLRRGQVLLYRRCGHRCLQRRVLRRRRGRQRGRSDAGVPVRGAGTEEILRGLLGRASTRAARPSPIGAGDGLFGSWRSAGGHSIPEGRGALERLAADIRGSTGSRPGRRVRGAPAVVRAGGALGRGNRRLERRKRRGRAGAI